VAHIHAIQLYKNEVARNTTSLLSQVVASAWFPSMVLKARTWSFNVTFSL
jgi:hypothetical protein